jgi:hypothetical protein
MSKYFKYLLILLFLEFNFPRTMGQESDQGLQYIRERFSEYCKAVPYEDIYIHTDREIYIAGEYLWFNTYLFDRQSSSLSSASSYAYIELLNPVNRPVLQAKIRLETGTGGGVFILPDSLSNGEYTLRAYTCWMKNFLPYGCFMKNITVYNIFSEKHFATKGTGQQADNNSTRVEFFPEGERIISGFVNKIGIRVSDKNGEVKGFQGFITDLSNDTLARVNTGNSGMCSFEFIPESGKNYLLKTYDGKSVFSLPAVFETGYTLHVTNPGKDFLEININTHQTSSSGNYNRIYLIIQSRGKILYSNRILLKETGAQLTLPVSTLQPGINQITVFDQTIKPVCNRYVYIPSHTVEDLAIKTDDQIGRRQKMTLEIDPGINYLSSGFSKFSLSVSALDANETYNGISDYLIPGNEFFVPGNFRKAPFSFLNSPANSTDDFLLTIKSDWIDWSKIMSDSLPSLKYNFEKNGQFLSGIIKNQSKTETNFMRLVYLSAPGKIPVFKYAVIDAENRFSFFIRDNEKLNDLIIQPADFNSSYLITIEAPFSQKYPESFASTDTAGISFPDETMNWNVNYQVDKIYGISYVDDTIGSHERYITPVRFYGKPDDELKMKDYINLPVMQEVFFELIPGIIVKKNKSANGIYIQDPVTRRANDILPVLLIDGVIIDDPDLILNLDPELVEEIDVIKSEYIIGHVEFSGIINVITKAGDFSNIPLPRNAVRFYFKDHDYNYRFKLPDYSSENKKKDRTPDFRNTLFWSSELKPDKNGKIIIDIPASDFVSDYLINFQGVVGNKPFSVSKKIRVE